MRRLSQFISVILVMVLIGLIPGTIHGQEAAVELKKHAQGLTDPAELEVFIDGIMKAHMLSCHIAGATFSVVKDGEIFFSKGYGYADVEKKILVTAERTMFRPGSVSKLFTWTAVMQLYEKGLLDLDADINTYLRDFKIPETYPEPITLKNLMTHTPGFEEMVTDMAVRKSEDLWPLGKYLAEHIPARVLPPGQLTAYSNYGTALAGYIVEVVAGQPFEDYIEENIFKPLYMNYSTFRQPPQHPISEYMSTGYSHEKGIFKAQDFELINGMAPAGSLSSSAMDMAKFMIAHLQYGQYRESRILEEETARLMQILLFTNDPKVNGNAYGFWEFYQNDLRTIGHGGDTIWFHSLLVLIPEKSTGFFVSYNSAGGSGTPRDHLMRAILDRYFPAAIPEPKPLSDYRERAHRFKGNFRPTRIVHTNFAKLMALMMNVSVKVTDEGRLLTSGSRQWVEVEPLVFQEIGGQDRLVFKEDEKRRITNVFVNSVPYFAFEKAPWFETPSFTYILLAICLLLFLSTLRWPIGAIFTKLCRRKREEKEAPRIIRYTAGLMSLLFVIFVIGFAALASDPFKLMFGVPIALKIFSVFPLIAVLLTVVAFLFLFILWFRKYWSGCARLHYTLVVAASMAFIWFLANWKLLGLIFY